MKKNIKISPSIFCFMMMLNLSIYAQAPLQWSNLHQRPGGNTGNLLGSVPKECNYDVKHLSSGNAIGVGKAYPVGSNPNVDCDIAIRKYRSSDGAVTATYYTDYYNGGRLDAAIKVIVAEPNIYVLATSEWISGSFDKDIILLKLDTALNYQWGQYFTN